MRTNQEELTKEKETIRLLTIENEKLKGRIADADNLAFIGTLSAGIMHEIKNPLGFVNNFAKLSLEITEELTEIVNGLSVENFSDSIVDIKDVSNMLDSNLKKILQNGERAQRIVFTMLSQSGTNNETIFESTDINQLVDEFTKLAYQGVRGNDKEFNLSIKTNYDPSIGQPSVGSQELSRVIINIVNNACYALNEKRKKLKNNFDPEIYVETKRNLEEFQIRIRDNGTGINQKIYEKLFVPFFTTKPKGLGTGLGLSLSYDIITVIHKGTLEVKTENNKYTEFLITIPYNR